MKKIIYITGSRSDFGLMLSTLKKIDKNSNLELSLIVTGMHLSKKYGKSINEIKKSGLKILKTIPIIEEEETKNLNMGISTGKCIIKLSKLLDKLKPDILLLEGDRFETLASAIAGAFLNIPIAHISGGDVSKSIDDSIRHAITKLAHIHFPGTKKSAQRIIKMGEEPWRVHMVGTPINVKISSKKDIKEKLGIDLNKKTILIIQHPVTTEFDIARKQMKELMGAINELKEQKIIIYPNNDPGSDKIINVIKEQTKKDTFVYKNLPQEIFTGILKNVEMIIGNSSAGIVEAPRFNIPCINLGIRQEGRERAKNVIDSKINKTHILNAIKKIKKPEFKEKITESETPYKSNKVEEKITNVLSKINKNNKMLKKVQTY